MATGPSNDEIRDYINKNYIEPARSRKETTITLRAGDIHNELRLNGRIRAVCSAIDAQKFAEQYRVSLSSKRGREQNSKVTWTFGIMP